MYIQRQLSSQLKKLAPLYPILSVSGPRLDFGIGSQFKGLRYYKKLATALPVEQDYYLIYGGEGRQERAHGVVLGWRDVGELV